MMDLNEEVSSNIKSRVGALLFAQASANEEDIERKKRVIRFVQSKSSKITTTTNSTTNLKLHHGKRKQHPLLYHLSTPSPPSSSSSAKSSQQHHQKQQNVWRKQQQHLKPLSLFILMSLLLLNYLRVGPLDLLMLAASQELPPQINLSHYLNQQQQQPPPSQLFLPPINQPPVSLVNGFHQKRSEEEEDGFIMQASSVVVAAQNETTTTTIEPTTQTFAGVADDEMQQQDAAGGGGCQTEAATDQQNEERIPIDVNRQQFVTHDQLSLLNASTKDESIYLSGGGGSEASSLAGSEDLFMNDRSSQQQPKAPTSRSGMSKVSHVSSFLSDLFAYATRPRQPTSGDETFITSGGHSTITTTTTSTTTTSRPQQQQQVPQVTANACPGICRSFLTASILCRNEINAPCPSLLQRCCDKDDVSFNGTPVETSAPLNPADSEPTATQLSDNPPQTQESPQLVSAETPTSTSPSATITPSKPPISANKISSQQPASAATTTTTFQPSTSTEPAAASTGRPGSGAQRSGSPSASTSDSTEPPKASVDLLLGSSSQPATIYFLSSANGSSISSELQTAAQISNEGSIYLSGGDNRQRQSSERGSVVQSDEQRKQSASQSFDSPLAAASSFDDKSSTLQSTQDRKQGASSNSVVVLQTVNGTILHHTTTTTLRPRPSYANWTDYHLSILQNRPQSNSQSVVYHSNTDPVKRFITPQSHQNQTTPTPVATTTISTQPSTTTTTTTQSITISQPDLTPPMNQMSSIKRTLALPSSASDLSTSDSDSRWPMSMEERDSQLKVKVMNDQHSASKSSRPEAQTQLTTPKTDTSGGDLATSEQQPLGAVGNVIAELIDSWISGSSASSQHPPTNSEAFSGSGNEESALDTHPTDQLTSYASPDQPVLGDQQNDRRLGYDLTFRQQQPQQQNQADPLNSSQETGGLMTSDGTSEQALLTGAGSQMVTSETSGSSQIMESKCSGYCTLPLFTMLCDSTYRSADCGPTQKCCVTGRTETSESGTLLSAQAVNDHLGGDRQQQVASCQGACLPVYHSSLCTKPNEIQLEAPGCLPSFVCCAHPLSQEGGSNNLEESDGMLGAGSSSVADQQNTHPATHHQTTPISEGSSSYAKDSSLFASLLPPPPPPLSQQMDHQQVVAVQEKNAPQNPLQDPLIVASTRQRQGPVSLLPTQEQLYPASVTRAPSSATTKTTQSGGGIMSHLYQMFKSNGSNKQRQRTNQQQTQVQQPQYQLQQTMQQQYPSLNYMPHIYDAYPPASQFSQQNRIPAQQQQQQLMYPHNLMSLGQTHFPSYSIAGSETGGLIDMQSKQINNNNRNRVYGQQQQQLPVREQQQAFLSNPPLQKFNPQQQQQSYKNPYQQQPSGSDLYQFNQDNRNSQLFGGQNSDQLPVSQVSFKQQQPPTVGQHLAQSASNVKPMSSQQQQQIAKPSVASQQHPSSPTKQSSGQMTFAGLATNSDDRQSYQPAVSTLDNAHIAPFKPQQQQSQYYPYNSQQQASLAPFAVLSDANIQNQKQINKLQQPQPQQTSPLVVQNRPIGNTPVRSQQQQPTTTDQRYHTVPSRSGNTAGQPLDSSASNIEQQKSAVWRQNAVSRFPNDMRQQPTTTGGFNGELNDNNNNFAAANIQRLQSPAQQTGNNWLSMAATDQQEQPLVVQHQQSDPSNRRGTGGNRPIGGVVIKASNGIKPVSAPAAEIVYPVTPSPSNVNVMITNGPFIDLQRVEQSNLEASRRQLLVGGQQQQLQSSADTGLVDLKEPPLRPLRPRPPQASPQATTQNWLPANQDDLSHSSSTNTQIIPLCPASCLAPFVSFNCIKPNYIDENFACTSPGSVCCLKATSLTSSNPSRGGGDPPVIPQVSPVVTPLTQPSETILDNNKLDLSTESDDQLDEIGKQHQVVAESLPADEAPEVNAGSITSSSVNSEQSTQSLSSKSKVKAAACGVPGGRRRSTSGRVMGGSEAKPGHWCWQAALMNSKNEYLCGGALIGSKWVLTAAHCITQHLRSESQLYVRLGQHNLNSTQSSDRDVKSIQVKTSYVHHNHNGITLDNDIALLRLEEAVDPDDPAICTVCLPERSSQMEPGKRCVVTGYGFEDENGPAVLRVKQADLPIVADQECQKKTGAVLGKPFTLPASSFCAGGELGQDACHGDGGSPLSCQVDGYYELTGIVSWGYKCGSKDLPGLYSKVSTFVGWINQIVSVNN